MALSLHLNQGRKIFYPIAVVLLIVRAVFMYIYFPDLPLETFFLFIGAAAALFCVYWESVSFANHYLNKRLPYEQGVVKRIVAQVAMSLAMTTPFLFLMQQVFKDMFPFELNMGVIMASYFINVSIIVALNIGYFGIHFLEKWKASLLEAERTAKEKAMLEKQWAQLQYNNLQNQLNPHFFFNSIVSLQSLIREDTELASRFLQQLSKVYRYILQNGNGALVSVDTEIQFVANYILLLTTRFGNSLAISVHVADDALEKKIVPVSLQVFIENALKHNRMSDAEPLHISIEANGRYLCIKNNYQPKKQVEYSNKLGLSDMKTLYTYLADTPLEAGIEGEHYVVKVPFVH